MMKIFGKSAWQENSALDEPESISSEIFGIDRFRQHAHTLAESQKTTDSPQEVVSIIVRLDGNAEALLQAYREVCATVAQGKLVTPAAEWLIDNYSLIEEHIRQTRADLPSGFYRQLPKLAEGHLAGHPRIFGIVWAYVAHNDSQFDPSILADFINEYQKVQPLTIGELWAVAISLRLILIENLRRVSQRISKARQDREKADEIADALLNSNNQSLTFQKILTEQGEPPVTQPFAVQLIQRLRDQDGIASEALSWLKNKLEKDGKTTESTVSDEYHTQSAANVTVRNIVTSMRLITDVNWESWFDSVSLVDKLLRTHPIYGAMDFPSRNIYRTAVEDFARNSGIDEMELARRALIDQSHEPGFFLLGPGRSEFEKKLNFVQSRLPRFRAALKTTGLNGYLGGATLITLLVLSFAYTALWQMPWFTIALLLALLSITASEFALNIINFLVTKIMPASILPGLALREGVTLDLKTLVVIPTLLTSHDDIEELVERLEVHFLSNAEGEIYFALLTDWTDAETETKANDLALLTTALNGIKQLNERHNTDRFFLFHRHRRWNSQQSRWMGWERKRGKLHELNKLLRGAIDTSFSTVSADPPTDIKYVITLDADTKLPRDAARRLVGKIAHPLNQPYYDQLKGRVTKGFGILQPRVTPSLPVGHYGSAFQRIFTTSRGIDPYVFAVSDVYQDLFGEGSFAGKGIYEIDALEAALADKIPENTLLSHDLFEGTFSRVALVTDIEVVEEFPEEYAVAAARQHRWTRGDWQLLPWIFGRKISSIPAIGQWKMIDNLRRSINPIATILSLLFAWLLLPFSAAVFWIVLIILLQLLPSFFPAIVGALPRNEKLTFVSRLKSSSEDFAHALTLTACSLLFLGHSAGLMADAIIRTLYRLIFSRKNLLEWTTAAQSASNHSNTLGGSYSLMASSLVASILAITIAFYRGDSTWFIIAPFAVSWLFAPAIAVWISRTEIIENALASSPDNRRSLRLVARRTWRYFENFVTTQDNMLPPDNFQETPKAIIAHRTSPTNIGLYLLSIVSAQKFGWIGLGDAISRIEATLASVRKLEKYQGHLYNWYDTSDLRTLEPRYISTVDSGNLAGHLIALSNSCLHWSQQRPEPKVLLEGLEDALDLLLEELNAIPNDRRALQPLRKQLEQQVTTLRITLRNAAETPEMIAMRLVNFALQANNIHVSATEISVRINTNQSQEIVHWADSIRQTIESHFNDSSLVNASIKKRLEILSAETHAMAVGMEFDFLLDPRRQLLSIGYRVTESARDESCYDMLASEARLASYFAIAKGDLKTRHWFRLARPVTAVKGGAALVSWSGSMFEYLMPSLVMRAPTGGLLDQTAKLIVERQMSYAALHGVPWGISESAFNARDIEFSYQYSNFGVPGLGLKRGLPDNLVIAPYATGLAAMVAPFAAAKNYQRLASEGARGIYGYYEAIDFTPARLSADQKMAVVQAYFAHHQGMTIVAILNAVKDGEMRTMFHAEPMVRATELLLQERAPRDVPISYARTEALVGNAEARDSAKASPRIFTGVPRGSPATLLLSNGQYNVMLTASGSGYSTWNGNAITRWREDGVLDDWGSFIYLKDTRSSKIWSAGHAPVMKASDNYAAIFSEEKAEFTRSDAVYTTNMECIVSPEDNAEARRITITNHGRFLREIELTTYTELVLAPPASDESHPVFSKMFVETEFLPDHGALLATRRQRTSTEPKIWVAQFLSFKNKVWGELEYETDRGAFIGRGQSSRMPNALTNGETLAGNSGAVLDPIFAFRQRIRIPAGRQVHGILWTVVADSRDAVLDLVDRHRQSTAYERAKMLAWTQSQIQLRHLAITSDNANLYQTLASHLIYANEALRLSSKIIIQDLGPQSSLWPQSIPGDRPILLLRIDDVEDIALVQQILQAFEYWKAKGFIADLVILNDRMSSYVQDLQSTIDALLRKANSLKSTNQVYLIRADMTASETLRVVASAARVVLHARRGSLAQQLGRLREASYVAKEIFGREPTSRIKPVSTNDLEFFNGYGGFAAGGSEYVTVLNADKHTPAPWINVIANVNFGFHASSESCGFTWFGNARENQITAWSNDPVSNKPSEVFYIKDLENNILVSPTLVPIQSKQGSHRARHGFGYTVYERSVHDLDIELMQLVPLNDAVKLSQLKITNTGTTTRSLSITFYADWVLGRARSVSAPFIITSIDESTGSMLARNPWRNEEGQQIAFVDMAGKQKNWTGDRREFLGTHGELSTPEGLMSSNELSNSVGAGMDPCCAMQTTIEIPPGKSTNTMVILGAANSVNEARERIAEYRSKPLLEVFEDVKKYWTDTLTAVQVKTNDRSFDLIMNGWLQYQTLACRMWARSGFYQASGAYGFRDQLQDSISLLTTRPEIAREHILRAASRQFLQGDFQHWWLPATGMGVRTHISDDTVWLPYCVDRYISVTGDAAILDEQVAFIEGQPLVAGQHDAFFRPSTAEETASLYEHCARALDKSLTTGEHGLPLFGTGDWNDGMNRVGEDGKGESVWLGWFLLYTLKVFSARSMERKDEKRSQTWLAHFEQLRQSMERHSWDGMWYLRGYYDDGTPLGSSESDECRIDAIAQSWSVISGAAQTKRAEQAMEQFYQLLVKPEDGLVQLFTPPFDKGLKDPGYVKAYPPGLRENGGQYTHGVIWSIFAHALLGQHDRAERLFNMLNPINHSLNEIDARAYRVEPYVIAADVYTAKNHVGRGGWTWYTGSASWMYRAGLEAILGVERKVNSLHVKPTLPPTWNDAVVSVKFGSSIYRLKYTRSDVDKHMAELKVKLTSDGVYIVDMIDDGEEHIIELMAGKTTTKQ